MKILGVDQTTLFAVMEVGDSNLYTVGEGDNAQREKPFV